MESYGRGYWSAYHDRGEDKADTAVYWGPNTVSSPSIKSNISGFNTIYPALIGAPSEASFSRKEADVTGYSLNPSTNPSLFEIAGIADDIHSVIGDIRDLKTLKATFDEARPGRVC